MDTLTPDRARRASTTRPAEAASFFLFSCPDQPSGTRARGFCLFRGGVGVTRLPAGAGRAAHRKATLHAREEVTLAEKDGGFGPCGDGLPGMGRVGKGPVRRKRNNALKKAGSCACRKDAAMRWCAQMLFGLRSAVCGLGGQRGSGRGRTSSDLHVHHVGIGLHEPVAHLHRGLEADLCLLHGDHGFFEADGRVLQLHFTLQLAGVVLG